MSNPDVHTTMAIQRWSVAMVTLCAALVMTLTAQGAGVPVGPEDEAVEQFLADHSLTGLLADHLEARLRAAPSYEKPEIAERLAAVYAGLLEQSEGVEAQRAWEERSEALLASVPEADSLELRLGLARASYKRVEKIAENWRLRIGQKEEIEVAGRRFEELARQFEKVASEANERVKTLEHQEETVRAADNELLATALTSSRRSRSLAHYLAGWCDLYLAELTGRADSAVEAERHFGWLLNARPGEAPNLDRLQSQTMRYAHVARSAIGVGVARGLRNQIDEALAWFSVVERADSPPPGIDRQLFSSRAAVLARGKRWDALLELVMTRRGPDDTTPPGSIPTLPTSEARLIAVLALEEEASHPDVSMPEVERLRDAALSNLVAGGELGHVLDLVRRFGPDRLGKSTFVAQNIRGLIAYDIAREAHKALGADLTVPTTDSQVARKYIEAADILRRATGHSDASQYSAAAANAGVLLGMSLYYAGDAPGVGAGNMVEAAERLVAASDRLEDKSRSAEALWMAIRALQHQIERKGAAAADLVALRDTCTDRFISTFPDDDRSAALMLGRTTSAGADPAEAIETLLRVPETSKVYDAARRQAARLAYEMFRAGTPADRDWLATRFLNIAEPMLASDRRRASAGDSMAAAQAGVRARQIIDAVMGMSAPDIGRAERALDVLVSLISAGLIDGEPIAGEIDYRRAQMLLVRSAPGDRANAEVLVDALQKKDARYATAASMLFYRDALAGLQRAERMKPPDETTVLEAAKGVVRHGSRLADAWSKGESGISDAMRASLEAEVADSAMLVWTRTGDLEVRDIGKRLARELLARQPRDARFLRLNAEFSEAAGEADAALESWRTLVIGLDAGTQDWFDAKYRLMSLLARIDPTRAKEVMAQHKLLYPDFGPPPWGDKIKVLDESLRAEPGKGATP